MINPPGDSLDELREFLYSLADRLTKSPTMEGQSGGKLVKTTSEGLHVTALIDIAKFTTLYPEAQIDALLNELEKEFSPDLGVYRDLNSIRFSRFITEGGPWVHEMVPGIKYVYEVGKPIVCVIDEKLVNTGERQPDGSILISARVIQKRAALKGNRNPCRILGYNAQWRKSWAALLMGFRQRTTPSLSDCGLGSPRRRRLRRPCPSWQATPMRNGAITTRMAGII